ncbi:S8 family serine peptidase [Streptomyces sp. NPDC059874]|uniref:S8 family peptidase n=1 Tax=Streptomyces sp. NPDC059874 TaxID=3346983 RepID=UPI003649C855
MNRDAANGSPRGARSEMSDAGVMRQKDEFTDRFLVLLDPGAADQGMAALQSKAGIARAERARGAEPEAVAEMLEQGGSIVFEELGVGVVRAAPDQLHALQATAQEESAIITMERERVLYATQLVAAPPGTAGTTADYLRGYQDGVEELVNHALQRFEAANLAEVLAAAFDESQATWGLQATRVVESTFTGQGVKVAVLDTGVDRTHPDLMGRFGGVKSFVQGETADDVVGHGTHCIGTACGPKAPRSLPRYGVACESEIFVGKVLNNQGRGPDSSILAGVNWAVRHGCRVVSMSLGAPIGVGQRFSRVFEHAAQRALRAGTLIVCAAGNGSDRPDLIEPVEHPANCPSILAVAALDKDQKVAFFSNRGINPDGGQVDIAAPGVGVISAFPMPKEHKTLMGTSMATPHVAGILALLAQANPDASAAELKSLLLAGARRSTIPGADVGVGLVQAP